MHHRPFAVVGHEEPVQIKVEAAILDGGAVDLGDQSAGTCQFGAVVR